MSLNGEWRFRWSPVADVTVEPGDPDDWTTIPVPSHWVLHGHGAPIYTNVQFPFPVDPPHPPDENPTGDHRRTFVLPPNFATAAAATAAAATAAAATAAAATAAAATTATATTAATTADARTILRFDGVESHFRVWVNDVEVGWGTGSRLATEFDVTDVLRPGENEIAVRVHQWSAASYLEDQDQWWLPGIFRDVTLLARPADGIDDVWVGSTWTRSGAHREPSGTGTVTGTGRITTDVRGTFPIRLRVPELGVDVTWATPADVAPIDVDDVLPWSAELPRLYDATVSSPGETVSLRLGFRTVEIRGDRFLVNGERVVFHGVNRHETHPERGRVFDEAHARADMAMMKRHNVNAIRTSHYPPHPRVLDLADELGFWVVLECDLETHGFEYVDWQGNPSDDPAWAEAFLDRIERTVERDKNHPSIVMWSLGNEAHTGRNLAAMSQWVHARDPERPVHYEGDHTGAYTDVYSRMYPTLVETEAIGGGPLVPLLGCGPAESARQRAKPFLHCEYVHAMGNGPGQIAEYEALVDRYPRLHGGFVWEWRDHGLLTHTPDGTPFYGYGGDFREVVHDGNFVMDGLVLPDDTPTPGLAEFAAVVAPIRFTIAGSESDSGAGIGTGSTVRIENRFHSATTAGLRFCWSLSQDGVDRSLGRAGVAPIAPRTSATVPVPAEVVAIAADGGPDGEVFLTITAELAGPTAWADTGHVVARAQFAVSRVLPDAPRPSQATGSPVSGTTATASAGATDPGGFALGDLTFTACGDLATWHGVPVSGPRLELWRAPTDNDRGASQGSYEVADPALTGGRGGDAPASAVRWEAHGLHRLTHRLVCVTPVGAAPVGTGAFEQHVRVGAANSGLGVDVVHRWTATDQGVLLRTEVVPFGDWDCTWPRVGVRIDLPASVADTVTWFGTGPDESYADSSHAVWVGRFTRAIDDLSVRYSRPQETGHRPELRSLELGPLEVRTVPDVAGHRAGFTLSRWTAQEITAAAHPHELPASELLHLSLDDAQHGLGSRACGLDVLPEHQLWPAARAWEVLLG